MRIFNLIFMVFCLSLIACGDKQDKTKVSAAGSPSQSNELPIYSVSDLDADKLALDMKYQEFMAVSSSKLYSLKECIRVADEYIDLLQATLTKYGRGYRIHGEEQGVYHSIENKNELLKTIEHVTSYREKSYRNLKSDNPKIPPRIPSDPAVVKPVIIIKPQHDCLPFGKTLYFSCTFKKHDSNIGHDGFLNGRHPHILACGQVPPPAKQQSKAQIEAAFMPLPNLEYPHLARNFSKKILRWSAAGSMNLYVEMNPSGTQQLIVGDYQFESFQKDIVVAEYKKRFNLNDEKVCLTGFGFRAWIDYKKLTSHQVINYLYLNQQKEPVEVKFSN